MLHAPFDGEALVVCPLFLCQVDHVFVVRGNVLTGGA